MKRLIAFIAFLSLSIFSYSQTVLISESFETDGEGTRYTSNSFYTSNVDFFTRMNNDPATYAVGNSSGTHPTNPDGLFYWGAEDCDVASGGEGVLTFNPIAVTGYSLDVSVLLSNARPNDGRLENADYFILEYNMDGGGWNTFGALRGNVGTGSGNLQNDANFDGLPDAGGFEINSSDFIDVNYTIPVTGNSLQVRCRVLANTGTESIIFDNIRVNGTVAGCTASLEDFETETSGATSFTDNGQGFDIVTINSGSNDFDIQTAYPGTGWNGSSGDNRYVDNDQGATSNPSFSIETSDGADILVKKFYIYLANSGNTLGLSGTLQIEGKKNGSQEFIINTSSGYVGSLATNNGFTEIDLSTYGGSDNSNTEIDELVITTGGNFQYLAFDAFEWCEGTPAPSCSAPTAAATSAVFGTETASSLTLTSFTAPAGGADGYAVYISDINSFLAPSDGDEPTADITWNDLGQQAIYFGNSASPNVTVSGLDPNTTYYYRVYAYNDCSGTETYGSSLVASDATAPCTAPTAAPTSAVFGTETESSLTLSSFTAPAGGADGYAVYINDNNVWFQPSDGTTPTADLSWNDLGQQAIYFGNSTSPNVTVSGLDPNTTYYFIIFPYNDCSGTETYGSSLGASDVTSDFNNLTIVNGGDAGPSSGTNWSISGTTLTVTGTASVDASVIETALGNGSLTIVGTDPTNFPVIVNEAINSSTAGNGLTIGSDVNNSDDLEINAPISVNGALNLYGFNVSVNGNLASTASNANILIKSPNTSALFASHTITTQGGKIILWTDSDNDGEGRIRINNGSNISSNGGDIVMAGGLDDGSNGGSASDGVPDGYASGFLGANNGIWLDGNSGSPLSINSSGGDITMKGQSSTINFFGIRIEPGTVSSGTGNINMLGLARGSGSQNVGIHLIDGAQITSDADITMSGTGSDGSGTEWGIRLFADASITCGGNLSMTAVAGSTSEEGIAQDNSGTGSISVTGTTTINTGIYDLDLQRVANDFTGAVTVTQARNVSIRDANAMTLGTVNATGDIDIATNTADLTLSGNIATTSTSDDAIILNAGESEAAGTATGGDIIISGSPTLTFPNTAQAKLFSGSESGSSGLTALVGGSSNTRFGLDETSNLSGEGLMDDNAYAIYRLTCTMTASITSQTNVECNGGNDGSLTVTQSGGTANFDYAWSNGPSTNNSSSSTDTISGLAANTYTVTVTDDNGCTATASATITEPAPIASPIINQGDTASFLIGDSLLLTTNAQAGITYSWYTPPFWDFVGPQNISNNSANFTTSAIAPDGTLYIGFSDPDFSNQATVMRFTGGTWQVVGSAGFTSAAAGNLSLSIASDGTPYLAYKGGGNRLSVSKFDGSNWQLVGSSGFSPGAADYIDLAISPDDSLFVAYRSFSFTTTPPLTSKVMKYDGSSWVSLDVSADGFGDNSAHQSLAVAPDGTPYLAFSDNANSSAATVVKYDGNSWSLLGNAAFSDGIAVFMSIQVSSTGEVHLAYSDWANSNKVSVAKFNGANWVYVGSKAFSDGNAEDVNLQFGQNDKPYVAFKDNANSGKATVMKYNGSNWAYHGSNAFTIGATGNLSFAVSNTDENYVTFIDEANSDQVSVMNYGNLNTVETNDSITVNEDNLYILEALNSSGCNAFDSIYVFSYPDLLFDTTAVSNVLCNGGNDGTASISVSSGTPPYNYVWSNGSNTATASNLVAGTYTVTVSDANLTKTLSILITEPATLVAAVAVDSNITCNGFSDGGATASATGGTTPYFSYEWSNSATTASITGVSAGTYTVTITDANGCTSTSSATITEPAALVASAVVDSNVSCNGFSDGGATASATGGTAAYNYLWSNSATTASITGVSAGTYTVTVTDANGCTSTSSATITEPPLVDASFAYASDEYCIDDSDPTPTITGVSGGIFSANSGLVSLNSSTGEIDLSDSDAGIYYITYATPGACTNTSVDTVEVFGTVSGSAGADQNVCGSSTFLASNISGYKAQGTWSIISGAGGSITDPNDPNSAFSGSFGTTYTLRWTVSNGVCSDATDDVVITFFDNPTPASAGPDQTGNDGVCGSLTTLTGNIAGGFSETGTWSEVAGDGNAVFTNVNNPTTTFSGTRGVIYTLRWTIGNGICPNSSDDVQVEFLLDPVSDAGADQDVCGASTFLNGTATNGTGVWRITGGAGGFLNDSTSANTIFSGTKGELYTLQWVVSNGSCPVASDFVNITFYDNTTIANAGADQVGVTDGICGDTVVLAANTANKFGETGTWSEVSGDGNGSFADVNDPNSGFSGTPGVSYTLSWFIDNGVCPSNADSVDIEFKEVVVASAAIGNQVSCFAAADGSIDLTVSGGTGNYAYDWSNNETTEDISGLDPDTYFVLVTDANGCSDTSMATITEPAEITGSTVLTVCDNYTVPSGDETYNVSGMYMDTIPALNGCDSIITIDLTVLYRSFSTIRPVVCDSYTVPSGNMTYTSSGGYLDTLVNSVGCDSIITIDLTVNYTTTNTEVLTVCDRYTVPSGDETYTSSGVYVDTIPNNLGCDSIITFDLTVLYSTTGTETLTVCDNYTVPSGDETYSTTGVYLDTIPNSVGCDSIITIDLTVNYSNSSFGLDRITACDSYTWTNGITYTSSNNTARDTFANRAGCDSVMVLDLTILNSTSATDQVVACDSYSWIDGNLYTSSNNTATFTFTNLAGCDSVITLDLTIINSSGSTDQITACDSYTWTNGMTYTSSNNTATDTFVNAAGCDSIVTLDLTINSSNGSVDQVTACDSYTWIDGNTYTASNNSASVLYTNALGCDSVVTLDLTILDASLSADVIRACESYTWTNGVTYTQSNVTAKDTFVNAVGCDSIVSLSLTILNSTTGIDAVTACGSYTWTNGVTYTASNNTAKDTLVNFAGCDSIVSLNLIIENADTTVTLDGIELEAGASNATYQWVTCGANTPIAGETGRTFTPIVNGYYAVEVTQDGCTTLSRCYSVTTVGIDDPSFANDIKVYPNPTNGLVTIDLGNNTDKLNIIINDVVGRSVYAKTAVTGNRLDVDLFEAKAGIYFINVADQNGNNKVIKLIKY